MAIVHLFTWDLAQHCKYCGYIMSAFIIITDEALNDNITSTLTLYWVTSNVTGNYTCLAYNDFGNHSSTAYLGTNFITWNVE